jgi:hypothetical protein
MKAKALPACARRSTEVTTGTPLNFISIKEGSKLPLFISLLFRPGKMDSAMQSIQENLD